MFRQISTLFLICFSSIFAFSQSQQTASSSQQFAILLKPPPRYTDEARQKNVSGKVVLKVTFLATGEIGDVFYISESSKKKKLTKYGLVEKAIEAARKIKFTPQIENGRRMTITKFVEYGFLLY